MCRSDIWIVGLSLLALPLSAPPALAEEAVRYRPLAPDQHVFYGLAGLPEGAIEIHYLVAGGLYLMETLDVAAVKPRREPITELPRRREPMMELLATRPDLVRELQQLAQDGVRVELSVHHEGRLRETLSFTEALRRSAVLRRGGGVPVVVPSTVIGPYEEVGSKRPVFAATYLENCADCTQTTPCDTSCGWDPDKGGPVTCGEYGVCEPEQCYWQLVQTLGWCDTDFDTHAGYYTVEIFGERRYQHTCTGATCYDKYQIDETDCWFGPGSCNTSAAACCNCAYPSSFCGATPGCRNDCPF